MNKSLVEWVKKERSRWTLIGVIRRNMLVSYRGKEGKVEELVKEARVVNEVGDKGFMGSF